MSDIYVPIDHTDLKSIIPPGEDIIYSTLGKGIQMISTKRETWTCHILITNKSLAYTIPVKKAPLLLKIIPLYEVSKFAPKAIPVYNTLKKGSLDFHFHHDPKFETKEEYKQRTWMFGYKEQPILIEAKRERLKEMESKPDQFKDKEIAKMRKDLESSIKFMEKNKKYYEKLKKKYEK